MTWDTPERIALREKIRTAWNDGLSGGEIGRALGLSRNVVLGMVYRMGLMGRGAPKTHLPPEPRADRPKPVRIIAEPPPPVVFVPEPVEPDISDDGQPITIMSVSGRHCRYPMNEAGADTIFCGRPPKPGSPYCPGHHRVCHVPPNTKPPESAVEQSEAAERSSGIRRAFG